VTLEEEEKEEEEEEEEEEDFSSQKNSENFHWKLYFFYFIDVSNQSSDEKILVGFCSRPFALDTRVGALTKEVLLGFVD